MIEHRGGKQTHKAASVKATCVVLYNKRTNGALLKRKSCSAIRLGMSAEVCAVWKPLSKGLLPTPLARVRLQQPVVLSGTVLDGCTSFYLLTTGVLLFPCRWPIHSLLPLTLSSFLLLKGQTEPPGYTECWWKASNQQNIWCWCLHTCRKPSSIDMCHSRDVFAACRAHLWSHKSFSPSVTKNKTANTNVALAWLLWDGQYWSVRPDWR